MIYFLLARFRSAVNSAAENCWPSLIICLAGAGLPGGRTYGSTDEIGWQAVEDRLSWHDLHASVQYLLGLDHERLTYYHNGIQRRLTNVHGQVVHKLIG